MIDLQSRICVQSLTDDGLPVTVTFSRFPGHSGVDEYHLMLCPTACADVAAQLAWLGTAYRRACASLDLDPNTVVLRRFFCSDLSNQAPVLEGNPLVCPDDPEEICAVSLVNQPPTPPAKVALWAYHVRPPDATVEKRRDEGTLALRRGNLTHLWTAGVACTEAQTPVGQTTKVLEHYEAYLHARGLTVADHVMRTWFFVQNADVNYHGLVSARRDFFATRGLTPETHYIASTGIEGAGLDLSALVVMDAYAIDGVRSEQISYLAAPEYLCPTYRYGVTFERGVSIAYQDRTHVLISGTASIDSQGAILHPGDVKSQLDRTMENVSALLQQAGASTADVCMYIAYVRDASDMGVVQQLLDERWGATPGQIVIAPVCRPGWLVEVECQAILPEENPTYPAF